MKYIYTTLLIINIILLLGCITQNQPGEDEGANVVNRNYADTLYATDTLFVPMNRTITDTIYINLELETTPVLCSDEIDNNANGLLDCQESECLKFSVCSLEDTAVKCSDGVDNDGDGKADCNDSDCQPFIICSNK